MLFEWVGTALSADWMRPSRFFVYTMAAGGRRPQCYPGELTRLVLFCMPLLGLVAPNATAQPTVLLDAMSQELNRNFSALKEKADPPPYFLSYEITEQEFRSVAGTLGTVDSSNAGKSRALDVSVRVGTPKLDNYHRVRGDRGQFTSGALVSFEDNVNSIKRRLWLETDRAYRTAAERLIRIKTNTQVKVAEADDSDDFSSESPSNFVQAPAKLKFTEAQWQEKIRKYSGALPELPHRAHLARQRTLPDRHALPGKYRRLARRARTRLRARGDQRRGQGGGRHRRELLRDLRSGG